MKVHVLHHAADAALAKALVRELQASGFVGVASVREADVAVLLVSRTALRDGLGSGPADAIAAGIDVLPLLVDPDPLPPGFPVSRKHAPLASDAQAALRHLRERRERGDARQIDSKRDLFGLGVLLALLPRG